MAVMLIAIYFLLHTYHHLCVDLLVWAVTNLNSCDQLLVPVQI